LGAGADLIEEVCDIVAHHHHPRSEETVNFKSVYDADLIVNMEENQPEARLSNDQVKAMIAKNFLTESGRKLAQKILF
jgi:hypothetical protein